MELTHAQKFTVLAESEHKETVYMIIDSIYDKIIEKKYNSLVLELVNKILSLANYKSIQRVEEFNMVLGDLIAIDGVQFINDNIDSIKQLDIDLDQDLSYNIRKKQKRFSIIILEVISSKNGYELYKYSSSRRKNNERTALMRCRLRRKID